MKNALKSISFLFFIFLLSHQLYSQEKIELKNADELSGRIVNGKNVREANGNVHFVQGNVNVYCNSATQYIDDNRVDLRGNVRIYQDTLTLLTSRGSYFGNEKRATGQNGITLKDPNATLTANSGVYTFSDGKAVFTGNVKVVNPDYTITSNDLTYFRFSEDSFAKGDVVVTTDSAIVSANSIDFLKRSGITKAFGDAVIESDSTIIESDTLINYKFERKSVASGNVKIVSLNNNVIVTGDYGENFEDRNYSFVRGNAFLEQIEDGKDTLLIYSGEMEAFRNEPEYYVAKENVRIIRGDFLAKCSKSVYYRNDETISLSVDPVVWQNRSQMTGDSIFAELPGEKLQSIYVSKLENLRNSKKSFLLTENEKDWFSDRIDQVSGDYITLFFENNKIKNIEVNGASSSIYFMYEEGKANGVNIINGEDMYIYINNDETVDKIVVADNPVGQYVPEIKLNEVNLRLPGFEQRTDKPERVRILQADR